MKNLLELKNNTEYTNCDLLYKIINNELFVFINDEWVLSGNSFKPNNKIFKEVVEL